VPVIADALKNPTARSFVTMLGTLLKKHPDVSIKDLEDIASMEYQQEEKKRLLAEYTTKPVREFVQFDMWLEGPGDDRPNWSYSRTLELMHFSGEVRILIAPDSNAGIVSGLLQKAADEIKAHPERVYNSNLLDKPDLDSELPF